MPIDYEKHKDDFMLYVWNNLDSLNYALRKNITYDSEIYVDLIALKLLVQLLLQILE